MTMAMCAHGLLSPEAAAPKAAVSFGAGRMMKYLQTLALLIAVAFSFKAHAQEYRTQWVNVSSGSSNGVYYSGNISAACAAFSAALGNWSVESSSGVLTPTTPAVEYSAMRCVHRSVEVTTSTRSFRPFGPQVRCTSSDPWRSIPVSGSFTCGPPPPPCPLTAGEQIDVTKSDADTSRPQFGCITVQNAGQATQCRVEKISDIGLTLQSGGNISHRLVYKVAATGCDASDASMQKFDESCLVSGGVTICPDMTPQKKNCGTVDGDEVCAEVGPDNCGEVNGVKQCAEIPTGCGMVNGDNICPPTTPTGCGTVNGTQVCPQALPNGQPFCVTTAAGNSVCSTQINEGTACVTTTAGNVHCTTFRNAPNTSPPKPDTGTPGQPAAPNSTVGAIGNGSTTTVNTYNSSTVNNSTHQGGGGGSGGEGEGCEGADCKPCGGPGQPECRVKINEAGTPASGSATSAAAAAGQKHQKDSDDFMTAAKALARGQGDDEAENFDSKSDEVKSGFLDKLSFLESSPACQQVTGTFSGKEFVFPGPAGCDRLERLKQIIGMAFFAYTILALAHVATAPKE